MSALVPPFTIGDGLGFAALALVVATALFMLFRPILFRFTKNLGLIRTVHLAIAAIAGLLLVLHASYFITYPQTNGIILGYLSFIVALMVWLTGSAFLEKQKDSLFFHGTLTVLVVVLVLMHAASSTSNIPLLWSVTMLGAAIIVVLSNAAYHLRKGLEK